MKKIAYSILAAVMIIAGTLNASAQSEETRQVSGFNSIGSSGPFDVHVKIDGTESLKISASSNVISEIETVVENGGLNIKFKHHNWNHGDLGKIDIYVTAKSLSALANAGSGSIKIDGALTGEKVNITLSGSGEISSAIKSDGLRVAISGSGSVHLSGNSSEASVQIAGSGELKGKELKTGSLSASITGSGTAYITAEKSVSAHIVGSGNVIYSGSAVIAESKTIGSGSVSKAD